MLKWIKINIFSLFLTPLFSCSFFVPFSHTIFQSLLPSPFPPLSFLPSIFLYPHSASPRLTVLLPIATSLFFSHSLSFSSLHLVTYFSSLPRFYFYPHRPFSLLFLHFLALTQPCSLSITLYLPRSH